MLDPPERMQRPGPESGGGGGDGARGSEKRREPIGRSSFGLSEGILAQSVGGTLLLVELIVTQERMLADYAQLRAHVCTAPVIS